MHICMKLEVAAVPALSEALRRRRGEMRLSNGEIARRSGADPSQVSRVLAGEFRTLSHNVVRICKVLGVDPGPATAAGGGPAPSGALESVPASQDLDGRLRDGLLSVWDRTPADAGRLAAFLEQLAVLRRPVGPRRGRPG